MILISHRGNVNGKFESYENEPNYIDKAISEGYDVEVDIWYVHDQLYLGHDKPQYEIPKKWLFERQESLWVHCKNLESFMFLSTEYGYDINYFWHETDKATLTSHGYMWIYPTDKPVTKSIAVMPEIHNLTLEELKYCTGICSDFIQKYKI